MRKPALRLLARTNNARGDLFTRLVKDLFFALGYDDLRLDVHKSGRELDLQGVHRFESRRVIAECKAEKEPIGGRDANTFLGVLTRERDKDALTPVSGYFVSLSGFRGSEVEQELETSLPNRVILLDGPRVVTELVTAHLLVDRELAVERAGRCAERAGLSDAVLEEVELLAHELGYLWAVFYTHSKQPTHFTLIHADGTPLAEAVARDVVKVDRKCDGTLYKLKYLAPPLAGPDSAELSKAAVARYCQWVAEECGFIQLDGLPADTDLSATRMKLERLFVPLKIVTTEIKIVRGERKETEHIGPLAEHLGPHPHLALVAKPGGGKSTLLKRLATAYAIPARRIEASDELPDHDWLPLFLRCRELRDRTQRPILELLDDLPRHAGLNDDEGVAFREQVHEALRSGKALLLVDGLDEISDEGARQVFAQHLRTFVAMFPHAAIIITSREAGFRLVAGVVASVCIQARLAPFDKADVLRLCESWHVEVVGDSDKVRSEAASLAGTIWSNERIRALAENPLMLTTLLVVRRCIGELPTRRVELYREAVRVLIRTWNTEGFVPLDLDEALAQLSYVACSMMEAGQQQIAYKPLLKLLQQARRELEAELQFAHVSPAEFIERIEYRSSLLMQTGHASVDGELQPVYEFRHLTFQEYLAALGLVQEQYPGRDEGRSLPDLVQPHFSDERWREVIPLATVLGGRKAEQIIQRLAAACESMTCEKTYPSREEINDPHVVLLRQCLLDEVQVSPATLRVALREMARYGNEEWKRGSVLDLRRGKYGMVFEQIAEQAYFGEGARWYEFKAAVLSLALYAVFRDREPEISEEIARSLTQSVLSGNRVEQSRSAFVLVWLAFKHNRTPVELGERLDGLCRLLRDALGRLLVHDDRPLALAVSWALVWVGVSRLTKTPPEPAVMLSLYHLMREAKLSELARLAAWAFSTQPLLPRDTFLSSAWGDSDGWFEQMAELPEHRSATVVLAWYRRTHWNDAEFAEKVKELWDRHSVNVTAREILGALGHPGRRVLEEWKQEEREGGGS